MLALQGKFGFAQGRDQQLDGRTTIDVVSLRFIVADLGRNGHRLAPSWDLTDGGRTRMLGDSKQLANHLRSELGNAERRKALLKSGVRNRHVSSTVSAASVRKATRW
jgi:hypothetical protein